MPKASTIHTVDEHIGLRMRGRRKQIGMSQTALADKLDISFQQVQKYERGSNRVSGSKLYDAARALGVTVSYFYEGLADTDSGAIPQKDDQVQFFAAEGAHELVDDFVALSRTHRRIVSNMARDLRASGQ